MLNKVLYSKQSDEWETPNDLFFQLNEEFHFTLDPCATVCNHKCNKFYTKEDNGLDKDWSNNIVFCNPPYSQIKLWVKKCYEEYIKGTTIVLLIPSRTDTQYFHNYIYNIANLRFIKGRLHFNNSKSGAPFPSMIAIFKKEI